ncbi:hypothetical protein FRC03_009287 [Tulasnella sp. 419]|nr:hypothetical protein FRC03_009287 [Tulasnella sp. 419]
MPVNEVAENVLGTIGTILWTIQLIPQVWKSWREKSTEGLSGLLMLIWSISAVFLGIYVIAEDVNIPLIIQPQLFGALAAVSWVQCLYYGEKRSFKICLLILFVYLAAFGGFEAGMTFVVRHALESGNKRVGQFFGIFSAVLISVGLIPQYIEIWKRKEVIGISMLFMLIDMSGGVFSVLSLVFRERFDVIAAITYIAVIVLDGVIVLAAIILNPRARRRREREQQRQAASDFHNPTPSFYEPKGSPGSATLTAEVDIEQQKHGLDEKFPYRASISEEASTTLEGGFEVDHEHDPGSNLKKIRPAPLKPIGETVQSGDQTKKAGVLGSTSGNEVEVPPVVANAPPAPERVVLRDRRRNSYQNAMEGQR